MNKKVFLITIDTEADNQWDLDHTCSTENAKFLPRFQEMAELFSFKPVWLTTYEMAQNSEFVEYFKDKQDKKLCEIGMHLHAWNTPPDYCLQTINKERSYLIEYPIDVIEKKIANLDKLLTNKFDKKPISHRAGRWTTNDAYFKILKKYNYKIDCSMTPHIDWRNAKGSTGINGSNYKDISENPFFLNNNILEIPVTIRKIRVFDLKDIKNIKHLIKSILFFIIKKNQWVRPDKYQSIKGIKKVIKKCSQKNECIMFMIHSSELMPNGSPNFTTKKDIEKLYNNIYAIFQYVKKEGYVGMTLEEYYYHFYS